MKWGSMILFQPTGSGLRDEQECPGNYWPEGGNCSCVEDGQAPDLNPDGSHNCDRETDDCINPYIDAEGVEWCDPPQEYVLP